jgi:hypothetical protein
MPTDSVSLPATTVSVKTQVSGNHGDLTCLLIIINRIQREWAGSLTTWLGGDAHKDFNLTEVQLSNIADNLAFAVLPRFSQDLSRNRIILTKMVGTLDRMYVLQIVCPGLEANWG